MLLPSPTTRLVAIWCPLGWFSTVYWAGVSIVPFNPLVFAAASVLMLATLISTVLTLLEVVRVVLALRPIAPLCLLRDVVITTLWGVFGMINGVLVANSVVSLVEFPAHRVASVLLVVGVGLSIFSLARFKPSA